MIMTHLANDIARATVAKHASHGVPHTEIAKLLAIAPGTLRKHYAPELERGEAEASAAIVGKLFECAIGGNVTALIFWTKTRLGWKESREAEALPLPDSGIVLSNDQVERVLDVIGPELGIRPYSKRAEELGA